MTTAVSSLARRAMRFGIRVAGAYLVITLGSVLLINLLRAMLDCRIKTGMDFSCTLFGVDVGSPLVSFGVALTLILYAWPLIALVIAVSFGLAAAFWVHSCSRRRSET